MNKDNYKLVKGNVFELLEKLMATEGHGPCVPKHARSKDTLCICKEMKETHACRCGLFVFEESNNE